MASSLVLASRLLLSAILVFHVYANPVSSDQPPRKSNDSKVENESMARTRMTDLDFEDELDLTPEETVPSSSALMSDGIQYRMPGLFAFNGGKPFSLEKDPVTGEIDFEKAPLKVMNYTAEKSNTTDYDIYDEDSYVSDVQSDDIYDKKNIDRKDGSIDGSRPNEINPYSPSFHDFLNLPVHYSSGKYSKATYPLISSSYANTKVQSGLNSYNTYNHRPAVEAEPITSGPPLYYTTHKTYLPKTTQRPATTSMERRPYTRTTTPPSTTIRTTPTTTTTTTTTTTQKPSTTMRTTTTRKYSTNSVTWKPSFVYSTAKPSTTTKKLDVAIGNHDDVAPFKPMPESNYNNNNNNNKPLYSNIPVSLNSHAKPIADDEYDDSYDYDGFEDDIGSETPTIVTTQAPSTQMPMSSTTPIVSTTLVASTVGKLESSETLAKIVNGGQKTEPPNTTFNLAQRPEVNRGQVASTRQPPPTSLPLGENHPQKSGHPSSQVSTSLNSYQPSNDRHDVTAGDSVKVYQDHANSNKVNPIAFVTNPRPYDQNNNVRPANTNPNGMKHVESTSSIIVPPGQNTVSFVLGNQQSVDGGGFVGTAIRENPYGVKNEGSFQPMYASTNLQLRPQQQSTFPNKQQGNNLPMALPSVAGNPKSPVNNGEANRVKPANNVDQYLPIQNNFQPNFNPQNRPIKFNNVESQSSYAPTPYLETPILNPSPNAGGEYVVNPQNGHADNSLNLGVRQSLNGPPLIVGSMPYRNDSSVQSFPVEASLSLGSRPATVDKGQESDDHRKHLVLNSPESTDRNPQNDYVVFPGITQDRPVEEHVIVINEADGSVQEFSPSIKNVPVPENPEAGLATLSERLTPPEKPVERPMSRPPGTYPPRPFDTRPRPYYPQQSDYSKPPRLPIHSKPPPDGVYKRPIPDSKLPNILPQFRPNAKSSHGHPGHELIGTIPAQYGPGRQPPPSRRPPPTYLQRLNPPPLPDHPLKLTSEPDNRFPGGKDGQYPDQRYQNGHHLQDNQRFRGPTPAGHPYPNSSPDRVSEPGSAHKLYRVSSTPNDRFPNFPTTERGQYPDQNLRRNSEIDPEEIGSFERFSGDPPKILTRPLINRRSSIDYQDGTQVATLQMIQQHGGLDERVVNANLPPPFRVQFDKDEDEALNEEDGNDDDAELVSQNKEKKRPVYVVYPVKSAVNINDDSQNDDESVVVGTRGPHRPLPPDTLTAEENTEASESTVLPPVREKYPTRPQNRPMTSDFPYPLERPDPSLFMTREKPLLVLNDKDENAEEDEEQEDESIDDEERDKTENNASDDLSINVIPYLQDYMPFPIRQDAESPSLSTKSNKQNASWPQGDTNSRILSKPIDREPLYRAPISVTLKTAAATTVTPIAYAYTPTADTPKLGIRPSELFESSLDKSDRDVSKQDPILPSQQPSSSSSSAPSPQNFMAPFMASVSAEIPSRNGWSVVAKPEAEDKKDEEEKETESQTEQSEFNIENFKPQLFGGFKPIYEFPTDDESNVSAVTEVADLMAEKPRGQ